MSTEFKDCPKTAKYTSGVADRRIALFPGRPRPRELNHLFVNNVRFWAILSIVAVHSSYIAFGWVEFQPQFIFFVETPLKFATVAFFLISGFLMGERVGRRRPVEYFMSRLGKVFLPWLFWFGIMCALVLLSRERHDLSHGFLENARSSAWSTLTGTAFWFVPNLLLCLAILLMCRRYLYSLKLGFVMLAINLVYVVNIYALWFSSGHTQALFGFLFYLWLGSYAAHNFERISSVLMRVPAAVFVATSLITGAAAFGESVLLMNLHNPNPLNTLKLSNQIFSISMVLLIFKFRHATWPGFMDIRRHTFGIYLLHSIILLLLSHGNRRGSVWRAHSLYAGDFYGVVLSIGIFVTTYGSSLLISKWLADRPSLQWMVGLTSQDQPRADFNLADDRLGALQ